MKILFILPAIGKKPSEKYIGTWKMAPLTLATLKGLTPKEHEVVVFDDRLELLPTRLDFDLACIVVETYTAKRSYHLSSLLRASGVKVALGGYHVTLSPDEASNYADTIITGNAEAVWTDMLSDAASGELKPRYHGAAKFLPMLPDLSVYEGKKYLPVGLVETGRGCVHRCEFCAITSAYQGCYHKRDIDDILRDIDQNHSKYFFLVDDNLVANRTHALELFSRLAEKNIKWAGQGTLSIGRDQELLQAMKKSGCEIILIGFESLNKKNLEQMGKTTNIVQERDQMVEAIHQAGINIYATFVFGYDEDDADTVAEALAFSKKHRFYTAAFNHLLPFPGTPLYDRLKTEDRLLYPKWWLADGYHYGELAFMPKKLSAEALAKACFEARKEFNSPKELLRRFRRVAKNSLVPLWFLFWVMNASIGSEVTQKMNVPIGENLDELPK